MLLDALRCMLTRMPGRPHEARSLGRLDYFKEGNCIIVVDTSEVLDRIERAVRDVDIAANQ